MIARAVDEAGIFLVVRIADRPYRRALTPDFARAELQAGAGTQFDPAVVTALIDLIDSGKLSPPASPPLAA